ncbi:MAG: LysR family transcriptional regulator [Alphaproteobacteria bacterium]|nr:LysR family transcriptional regulator [Alphaproteobacteria bacterium]
MTVRNFDTPLLRTFVTVAEFGNMTQASQVLNLTQGAVSQHIKRLEAQLGSALFRRERPGLSLTEAGDRLFGKARRLLAINDELWSDMTSRPVVASVSLGVPVDLLAGRLPSILRLFAEAHPDIEINLKCHTSPDLRAKFDAGLLDVTLLEEPAEQATGRQLYRDRLVWAGAKGGKAGHGDPLPLSLVTASCVFRPRVIRALDRAGRAWRYVYESDSLEATVAMIRMDLAVGTFLTSAMPDHLEPIDDSAELPTLPNFSVSLLTRETPANPPAADLASYLERGLSRG